MMINPRISRNPFTVSQWQELELQALTFKYMVAGVPVPAELLLPMKRGLDSGSSSVFQRENGWDFLQMGFGRKADPEPGRCRRTDGKKWRCSKDAFPDSKYCERHMHRGRNRSRKPVELNVPSSTANRPYSSTCSSLLPSGDQHNVSFQAWNGASHSSPCLSLDTGSYSSSCQRQRHSHAPKDDRDEHSIISKGMDSSISTDEWSLTPLKLGTLDLKKERDDSMIQNDLTHLLKHKDYASWQHHYYMNTTSFMGGQSENSKEIKRVNDVQPLRCFFDEWPKDRDSWSTGFDQHQPSEKSLSTTQLSISIPMASSDFSLAHT